MSTFAGYQLARRYERGVLGMSPAQSVLAVLGLAGVAVPVLLIHTLAAVAVGSVAAACCAAAAFVPIGGQPLFVVAPALARFTVARLAGRQRWPQAPRAASSLARRTGWRTRRRPPAPRAVVPGGRRQSVPRCLVGLSLQTRPSASVGDPSEVRGGGFGGEAGTGVVHDARAGTLTVVLRVRGSQFTLLDPAGQHAQLRQWGEVLNQFGREASPLVRLGWSLWSGQRALIHSAYRDQPTPDQNAHEHANVHPGKDLSSSATSGLAEDSELLMWGSVRGNRHDLRVWISVDSSRTGADGSDPARRAIAAAALLADRCQAAGLSVTAPLTGAQIEQAVRLHADPFAAPAEPNRYRCYQKDIAGTAVPTRLRVVAPAGLAGALPRRMHAFWDAVRVGGAWHRSWWVSGWPDAVTHTQWLAGLLSDPAGVRTITTFYEPVALRASRRRITADAVALDSQLQLRHKHDFRVPVHLHHAQADIDQREAELGAGWCEYAHLTLITITAPDPDTLDRDCQTLLDQAAQAGITGLHPLHARHDHAWAASLPLGRCPDREPLSGAHS